tara:strand:+ start:606 stop:1886 length:1281 start_codon:yes stop_codon:yes gene_type:complete
MILKGRIFHFLDNENIEKPENSFEYIEKGGLVISGDKIIDIGEFNQIILQYPNYEVIDHKNNLIFPGFIDLHNHFPQVQVIGSYGTQLLEWLSKYTFPEESKFISINYSKKQAKKFLKLLISNGTTTSVSFCSVHKESVNALFEEASKKNMCMIAGKVMMDRNAPKNLLDTPQTSFQDTQELISKWHRKNRNFYAITPRFAITSSPEQLKLAGDLLNINPTCYIQTHLSENRDEIEYTLSLYPKFSHYLDIYLKNGIVNNRSLMGHSIHLSDDEISIFKQTRAVAVHCPTSNLFLGSGLYPFEKLYNSNVNLGISTDVGGGTSYSMLNTLDAAYKIQQFRNFSLNPKYSFYWATLGNAKSLGLQDEIGSFKKGSFADIIVLDSSSDMVSKIRMETCETLAEELFILQTLGGAHSIKSVYIAGNSLL